MGADLGVLGKGCASMGVISVVEWKDERNSSGEGLNEEEGDASRFKSTPNAPKMNVYNDLNVTQKDEGERAWGQAGRPRVSGIFLFGLSTFRYLGA